MTLVTRLIIAALVVFAIPNIARADYPDRKITIITPFGAGASFVTGQHFVRQLETVLKVPVILEPRASGGGIIGTRDVVRSTPDGYTALWAGTSNLVGRGKLPYDPRTDLTPAGFVTLLAPPVVIVRKESGIRDPKGLRSTKNWSTSTGTLSEVGGRLYAKQSGIDAQIIPAGPEPRALQDVLSGTVDYGVVFASTALGPMQNGSVRALVQLSTSRSPLLPGVPTLLETGVLGFDLPAYNSIWFPASTPAPVVATMTAAIKKVQTNPDPEFIKLLHAAGATLHGGGPDAVAKWFPAASAEWMRLIEEFGLAQ